MDEQQTVTSWLPDVTRMPLSGLLDRARDDPELRAAVDRVVAQLVDRESVDGCGC